MASADQRNEDHRPVSPETDRGPATSWGGRAGVTNWRPMRPRPFGRRRCERPSFRADDPSNEADQVGFHLRGCRLGVFPVDQTKATPSGLRHGSRTS